MQNIIKQYHSYAVKEDKLSQSKDEYLRLQLDYEQPQTFPLKCTSAYTISNTKKKLVLREVIQNTDDRKYQHTLYLNEAKEYNITTGKFTNSNTWSVFPDQADIVIARSPVGAEFPVQHFYIYRNVPTSINATVFGVIEQIQSGDLDKYEKWRN